MPGTCARRISAITLKIESEPLGWNCLGKPRRENGLSHGDKGCQPRVARKGLPWSKPPARVRSGTPVEFDGKSPKSPGVGRCAGQPQADIPNPPE